MNAFVVDVNVGVVANGKSSHADLDCQIASVEALQSIVKGGLMVLDDQMEILELYRKYLSPSGQPGVGDAFMQWVWENQAVAERCERVPLSQCETGFKEFPDDSQLNTFDLSDRIYVAVAKSSQNNPEILNSVDSDWWEHQEPLAKNGLRVRFLCPQHMSP